MPKIDWKVFQSKVFVWICAFFSEHDIFDFLLLPFSVFLKLHTREEKQKRRQSYSLSPTLHLETTPKWATFHLQRGSFSRPSPARTNFRFCLALFGCSQLRFHESKAVVFKTHLHIFFVFCFCYWFIRLIFADFILEKAVESLLRFIEKHSNRSPKEIIGPPVRKKTRRSTFFRKPKKYLIKAVQCYWITLSSYIHSPNPPYPRLSGERISHLTFQSRTGY